MFYAPIVISGTSCVGKTTVAKRLAQLPGFNLALGSTTRPPRKTETPNVDYCFVHPDNWNVNSYLEVNQYHGHNYGYNKDNLQLSGAIFVVNVGALLSYPLVHATRVLLTANVDDLLKRSQSRPERRSLIYSELDYIQNHLIHRTDIYVFQNTNPEITANQIAQAHTRILCSAPVANPGRTPV
jgi:guanylate kinase